SIDGIDGLLDHMRWLHKLIRWETEITIRFAFTACILNHIMPDRSGARNTNYLVRHICTIGISRPDPDYEIRRISKRPVVLKVVGGAGFGRHRTIIPIILHGKYIITSKLNSSRLVIRKYR